MFGGLYKMRDKVKVILDGHEIEYENLEMTTVDNELTHIEIKTKIYKDYENKEIKEDVPRGVCGCACEVFSRVTGYYQQVANYNLGKKEEFKQRKTLTNNNMQEFIDKEDSND